MLFRSASSLRFPVLSLLFGWLAACGGSGAPEPQAQDPATAPRTLRAAQEGDMVAAVRSQWERSAQGGVSAGGAESVPIAAPSTSADAVAPPSDFAGAPSQVAGVEEDDLVQTDGQRVITLAPDGDANDATASLTGWHRDGTGAWQVAGRLRLDAASGPGPVVGSGTRWSGLLADFGAGRGVVLGHRWSSAMPDCPPNLACPAIAMMRQDAELRFFDVDGQGGLTERHRIQWQGEVVASRRVGSMLYLVSVHQPLQTPWGRTQDEREAALATLKADDVLPAVVVDAQPARPLVQESACYTQPGNGSPTAQITTLTAIDLSRSDFQAASRCFVGGTEAAYLTATHLYLATSRWPAPTVSAGGRWVYPASGVQTDIHKFTLAGSQIAYRASGTVDGHLGWDRARNSYRLDAQGEDLRVLSYDADQGWATLEDAVSSQAPAASPARLSILHDAGDGQDLKLRSTLPNARRPEALGHAGEQIYGVRFAGERAYLVTFRRTDPLYVLDLSDGDDPRVSGAVELSGYSSDLFVLPQGLLLGAGPSADAQGRLDGLKLVLFDVGGPGQPQVLDSRRYGAAGSLSALDLDRHGLSLMTRGDTVRVAWPLSLWSGGTWASQGLQTLHVDLAARRLVDRGHWSSLVQRSDQAQSGWGSVGQERGLFIDDELLYLSGGQLRAQPW